MRRQRLSGFTLIELLVTVVIVAVLALVVAPSLVRLVANLRLQGVGDERLSDCSPGGGLSSFTRCAS